MPMLLGLASIFSGALLASRQSAFWSAARSLLALHMMFAGLILLVVGASERRARAQYDHATSHDPDAKHDR